MRTPLLIKTEQLIFTLRGYVSCHVTFSNGEVGYLSSTPESNSPLVFINYELLTGQMFRITTGQGKRYDVFSFINTVGGTTI